MESLKDYKKHLESLKDYKKYLKLFNYKEEDTQEIIRKLFVGGLIYIISFILPTLLGLFATRNYDNSAFALIGYSFYITVLFEFIGILIVFIGVCNVIYKILKLIDLLIESKK